MGALTWEADTCSTQTPRIRSRAMSELPNKPLHLTREPRSLLSFGPSQVNGRGDSTCLSQAGSLWLYSAR